MSRCPNCQHDTGGCNCNRFTAEQVYGKGHEHNWVYLRQNKTIRGKNIAECTYSVYDVFYCSGCSAHKNVLVSSGQPGMLGPRA